MFSSFRFFLHFVLLASTSAIELTVLNTADSGSGSLRAAIATANSTPGFDSIVFAQSLQNETIVLSEHLVITSDMSITGFTEASLTLDAELQNRLILVPPPEVSGEIVDLNLSFLTLVNGNTSESSPAPDPGTRGGAFYNGGIATINQCIFRGNDASSGGAIVNFAPGADGFVPVLEVNNSVFTNNLADQDGAAIDNLGSAFINNCTFDGNSTDGNGGAITTFNNLTLTDSSFTNNSTLGNGGAFFSSGTTRIERCTFSNNRALTGNGGAIDNCGAPFTMINVTLSANTASQAGGVRSKFSLQLINCTLTENSALTPGGTGGVLFTTSGRTQFTNNLFVNNTGLQANFEPNTEQVFEGAQLTTDSSLLEFGIPATPNLLLTPLQDNGGRVLTHALLPGSPAIDRGSFVTPSSAPLTDARGVPRVLRTLPGSRENIVDLGAFESTPTVTLAIEFNAQNQPMLQATGLPGATYSLERSPNLDFSSSLSTLTFTLDATGQFSYLDETLPLSPRSFYRLRVLASQ